MEKTVKIGAAVGAVALAFASALATAWPAAGAPVLSSSSAPGLSVTGKVACPPGQPVDGVWVDSSGGGSNYARWRAISRSSASYTAWLTTSTPTAISLHVGCGGSTVDWESANWTPAVLMVTRAATINAECAGGQCGFPYADRAAAWAQRHLAVAGGGNQALRSDRVTDQRAYASWAGLDVAFVVSAYLNGAGILPRPAVSGSASAVAMYQTYASDHLIQQTWVTGSGISPEPPAGSLVFYSTSAAGGQIAISTGAGEVVSVGSAGSPLIRQQRYASIPGYRGWAFPANMVVGPPVSQPQAAATHVPSRHPSVRAAHPARPSAVPRSSAPGPADAAKLWVSRALVGCLALLAVFALVFAGRALLGIRRKDGRLEGSFAAAASRNSQARARARSAGAPTVTRVTETASSIRSRTLPPAPGPPVPGRLEPLPDTHATASQQAADQVSAAGRPAPYMAELTTVGGSGGSATEGSGGGRPLVTERPRQRDDGRAAERDGGWRGTAERPVFSPVALRLLGLQERPADDRAGVAQRHVVVFEGCRVETVLAKAPADSRKGKSPEGRGWVASAPYLVWTPLPSDVPGGGTAFACVGAGQAGCLFIDLAAAPGALALGGEPRAASRLAASLASQLCTGPAAHRVRVVVVADTLPEPAPPRAEGVRDIGEIGGRRGSMMARKAELVFCRPKLDTDLLRLARYVTSAPYRVVPVILADLPGAPWSFTTHPSRDWPDPVDSLRP